MRKKLIKNEWRSNKLHAIQTQHHAPLLTLSIHYIPNICLHAGCKIPFIIFCVVFYFFIFYYFLFWFFLFIFCSLYCTAVCHANIFVHRMQVKHKHSKGSFFLLVFFFLISFFSFNFEMLAAKRQQHTVWENITIFFVQAYVVVTIQNRHRLIHIWNGRCLILKYAYTVCMYKLKRCGVL